MLITRTAITCRSLFRRRFARLVGAGICCCLTSVAQGQSPTVTALSPVRNARSAPRTTNVAVGFNQALNNNAATLGALKVFSQQAGGKKVGTATVSGNTLTFNSNTDFKAGETVYVTATSEAQSAGGTATRPHVFQFTTAVSPSAGAFANGYDLPISGSSSGGSRGYATGDVNGDGLLDIINLNSSTRQASVRFSDGAGTFSGNQEVPIGPTPYSVRLADIDGDQDLDMLVANQGAQATNFASTVSVRFNDGAGIFSGTQEVSVGQAAFDVAVGDVDGDGDLDFVASNGGSQTVSVRLNNGAGSFSTGQEVSVDITGFAVVLADVDNDGDLDMMVAYYYGSDVVIRLNNGDGTFSKGQTVDAGGLPADLAMGDVDGDGDLDLLVSAFLGGVDVRRNDGAGNFSGTQRVAALNTFNLGDVDGDGDLDMVGSYSGAAFAQVQLNDGAGNFGGGASIAVGGGTFRLADMDGDGDLDLLSRSPSAVTVRLNQVTAPPQLVSVAPITGQVPIARNTPVTFSFNQSLSTGAPTQQAVKVFSQQAGGKKAGTTAVIGGALRFTPSTDFKPGETVFATVTTAVQSSTGANSLKPYIFQFTTDATAGPASYITHSDLAVGASPLAIVAGDVDGDGDLDLLTASTNNTVNVRLNSGNGTYSGSQNVPVGAIAQDLRLGDVDNDGDLDLVSVSVQTNAVSVRLNNGQGIFSGTQEVPVGGSPQSLTLGDVDGDGDFDLVTANNASTASVRLNNGNGTFNPVGQQVSVGTSAIGVVLGDVDGDGDLDLLTGHTSVNTVSLRLNDGTGTFGGTTEIGVSGPPRSLTLGDVDLDGDLDLVTGNYAANGKVSVRIGNGRGNFGGGSDTNINAYISEIQLGNIGGTRHPDLIVGRFNSTAAIVCRNNEVGEFYITQEVPVDPISDLALGDLDGDGDLDFATSSNEKGLVNVRLNQRGGPPVINTVNPSATWVGNKIYITGLNFIGDVKVKISGVEATNVEVQSETNLTAIVPEGAVSGAVIVITAQGTSSPYGFSVVPRFAVTALAPARNAPSASRTAPVTVTFTQQPNTDSFTLQSLRLYSQQAGGRKAGTTTVSGNSLLFTPISGFKPGETITASLARSARSVNTVYLDQAQTFQFTAATNPSAGLFGGTTEVSVSAKPQSVVAADVDGDGDLDLLTANYRPDLTASGTVSIRLNKGNGTYTNGQEVSVGAGPYCVKVADTDGDGDLDLLTANANAGEVGTVSVRLNNGTGTFSRGQDVPVGYAPHDIAIGDVNQDGLPDLLAANYIAAGSNSATVSTVSVRLQNGLREFRLTGPEVPVGPRPTSVVLGDVNNDGNLDLLTANSSSTTVSVRLNDGLGNFSGTQEVTVGFSPHQVVLGDVNNDGNLDLLTANYFDYTNPAGNFTSSTVGISLNQGAGTFGAAQQVRVGQGTRSLALGDTDGDGDLDVVAANELSNTVSVRLNNGAGSFSGTQQVAVGATPTSVTLADLDGDGTLDLATTNNGAASVSVRLNPASTAAGRVLATAPAQLVEQVSLYPNPAHASVQLTLPAELAQQRLHVQVVNSLGQVVLTQTLAAQATPELALPHLAAGLYNLQLQTSKGLVTKRLAIE
ncbi:FG-GAP-like repeat-containing protein [Hymenobacter crusticola]|uniref:SbsA Ig-like domain-containing protein n=1 Tax=Hymenobacter crusticola TaxID=1770526 RepID=A0A243W5Q9_9BACT|nr:FG-GAP-like repeat-containing protein [Hymenobacter crusticola]OUJ68774.1 hypothetical protein BXP70_27460 [Hymenobacter crusticola]